MAVSMMTARSASWASALGTSSTPLMFGMRMSDSITSGESTAWRSSASAPLVAWSTRYPRRVRKRSSAWRMPSSSSTTSTVVGLDFVSGSRMGANVRALHNPSKPSYLRRADERVTRSQPRRRRGHHRGPLDRRADRDGLHGRARAARWDARGRRRPRSRHRHTRARRAAPAPPRRPCGRDPPHRRLGLRARRGGPRGAGEVVVGGLVVANAVGNVLDGAGRILAGARGPDGRPVDALRYLAEGGAPLAGAARHTTLAVVATNAALDKLQLEALAHAAGDALARRIVPYGTPFDGDVVFAVSTAAVAAATPLQVEALAALAVPEAVERAVRLARGMRDIPGLADVSA